jgi:DNA replication and repair protein RecF
MITSAHLQNFRKHADYRINFSDKTIIVGPNGSGKTSILEAVYVSLVGRSWRSNFEEITRRGQNWWRVDVVASDDKRSIKYKDDAKTFEIQHKIFGRLPNQLKKPVILFEPQDLNLVFGSPARRRDFIDKFAGNFDKNHQKSLSKYQRVLKQRNQLLKNQATRDELFVWDIQFAELADKIIKIRENYVSKINKVISEEYQKIAGLPDKIELKYESILKTKQAVLNKLYENYTLEKNSGYTSVGPHQHDLSFIFNHKDASSTVSRGENRTLILALKNSEHTLLKDSSPVVLLDDIMSEFDETHQKNLLNGFAGSQVVITSVKSPKDSKDYQKVAL